MDKRECCVMSRNIKIFLLIIVLVLIGVALYSTGDWQTQTEPDVPAVYTHPAEVTNVDPPALTEEGCSEATGEWNECGSICRIEPVSGSGIVCVEMCVEMCECKGDDQCPAGHSCQEFVGEVGICKP